MARDAFNLGVLGMLAEGDKMAVIGNNIANSRTTAFKAGDAEFSELFVTHSGQSVNGTHIQFGTGVKLSGVTSDWSSGSLEETSSAANIAVEGEGFFAVQYPDQDDVLYTRAGDFALTEAPVQTNSGEGYVLMRPNGVVLNGAYADNVQTDGTIDAKLGTIVFVAQKYEGGTWREWDVATDGPMPSPTSFAISAEGVVTCTPAAADTPLEGDIRSTILINGNATEATSQTEVYIGVQRFNNPDSLQSLEGGLYQVTNKTSALNTLTDGSPKASVPNQNGCGKTRQGMLEQSNVDLVTEFTEMIITQRAYQANSKTITTADEMLQTVMGLKR